MSDMGSPALVRQPPRKDQAIVAFDFDGTLTVRDSFTAFLRWRAGAGGWFGGLATDGYDNDVARITANVLERFRDPSPFAGA